MGTVDQIYISKLNQVQGILQNAASRAGFTSCSFAEILNEVQSEVQNNGLTGNINQYTGLYSVIDNAVANDAVSSSAKSKSTDTRYDSIINAAAQQYDLDPNIIKAVIRAESSFQQNAVSKCGAMGLMQLMPGTAEELGVTDAFDPAQNVNGGAAYIKKQLKRFGDLRLALAAYNAGPGRIAGLKITDPDDPEQYEKIPQGVRGYVEKVLAYYKKYST